MNNNIHYFLQELLARKYKNKGVKFNCALANSTVQFCQIQPLDIVVQKIRNSSQHFLA